MTKFLNRESIISEIVEVIREARNEIIMVVPFITISPTIFSELKEAEKNGKEILLVYREDSMKHSEKEKLYALNNLTIMNHPNVHAKCYLNETSMIISSMNLYEPTETKNREMGIKIEKKDGDGHQAYNEAIGEIRAIVNASTLEKESQKMIANGFMIKLLRPKVDYLQPYNTIINRVFVYKRFEIIDEGHDYPSIRSFPYHENVSVDIDYIAEEDEQNEEISINLKRLALRFKHKEEILIEIHKLFHSNLNLSEFKDFNIYWDYYKQHLTIYPDRKRYPKWETNTFEMSIKKMKQGLDKMIQFIKTLEKKV